MFLLVNHSWPFPRRCIMELRKGILLLALIATPCLFSEGCGHGSSARVVPDGGQPLDEAGLAAGDVAATPDDAPQLPPIPDAEPACPQGGCDAPAPPVCPPACDATSACKNCDAAVSVGPVDTRLPDAGFVSAKDTGPVVKDVCAGITCSGHGTCAVSGSVPVCQCEASYHPEGTQCIVDGPLPKGQFNDIASSSGLTGMTSDLQWCFGVTVEDVDDDGLNDVFFGDHGPRRVLAWNASTPTSTKFTRNTEAELPTTESQTWIDLVYDFDNDGCNDLSQNWDTATYGVMHNDCSRDPKKRTFSFISRGKSIATDCNAMAWSDWNGDGVLDYMIHGYHGGSTHPGTGNGTFSNLASNYGLFEATSGKAEAALFAADLTGDDWPDLLMQPLNGDVFTGSGHKTMLAVNDTKGGFTPNSDALKDLPSAAVALGDIDNDGDLDVFGMGSAAGANDSLAFKLYRNLGGGKFEEIPQTMTTFPAERKVNVYLVIYFQAAFIDFDGDGFLDILASDENADRLFQNQGGSGAFKDVTSKYLPSGKRILGRPTRLSVGDLTGDNIPDFITTRAPDNPPCGVQLFRNDVNPDQKSLMVKLVGKQIKNAVNSKLTLRRKDGSIAGYREVLLSTTNRTPLTQHFALKAGETYSLEVKFWPPAPGKKPLIKEITGPGRILIQEE